MSSVTRAIGQVTGGLAGGLVGGLTEEGGLNNQYQGMLSPEQKQQLIAQLMRQQQVVGDVQGGQKSLANYLTAQQQGQTPSVAQLQLKEAMDKSAAMGAGQVAGQRGINTGLAQRLINQNTNMAQQATGAQSALLRAQEQQAATANLGNLYGQMGQTALGQQQAVGGILNPAQQVEAQTAQQNAAQKAQITGGLINAGGGMGASAMGGKGAAMAAYDGGIIPGSAMYKGDTIKNDTVHAVLSPGEIVIPRSKANDPDKAKDFVEALLAEKKKKEAGYGDVLKARKGRGA